MMQSKNFNYFSFSDYKIKFSLNVSLLLKLFYLLMYICFLVVCVCLLKKVKLFNESI